MKEGGAAGVAAGLLISVALLRMAAPALPFDWMTLALILGAALIIWLAPESFMGKENRKPGISLLSEPFVPGEMEALRGRMEQVAWPEREGGMYDSLRALHREKPFAAMCAERGMLAMLMEKATNPDMETATVALLLSAMDALAAVGEGAACKACVDRVFAYGLGAIGYLEQVHG